MMLVVDEYEKTISEVLSERERETLLHDIEVEKITNQRNQVIVLYTQVFFILYPISFFLYPISYLYQLLVYNSFVT